MRFSTISNFASLLAVGSALVPSISVTLFPDLECAVGPGEVVTLSNGTCSTSPHPYSSILIPSNINSAFEEECGFIGFDVQRCTGAVPVNIIGPAFGLGKCIPALKFGNFGGPLPLHALTLACGPFI